MIKVKLKMMETVTDENSGKVQVWCAMCARLVVQKLLLSLHNHAHVIYRLVKIGNFHY